MSRAGSESAEASDEAVVSVERYEVALWGFVDP